MYLNGEIQFNPEAVGFNIAGEVRTNEKGIAFISARGVNKLTNVPISTLLEYFNGEKKNEPDLYKYLRFNKLDVSQIKKNPETGYFEVPDLILAYIIKYYAYKAPIEQRQPWAEAVDMYFTGVFIRTWFRQLSGWKEKTVTEETVKEAVERVITLLLPEDPEKYLVIFTPEFYKEVTRVYGEQLNQRSRGMMPFINAYIWGFLPEEFSIRLKVVNPNEKTGRCRRPRQNQRHLKSLPVALLQQQVSVVETVLRTAPDNDPDVFRAGMKKQKKLRLSKDKILYLAETIDNPDEPQEQDDLNNSEEQDEVV